MVKYLQLSYEFLVHDGGIHDTSVNINIQLRTGAEKRFIYIAILTTTNSMWNELGLNPGLNSDRLAAECSSHGTK